MVGNSNRDSEFSSEQISDALSHCKRRGGRGWQRARKRNRAAALPRTAGDRAGASRKRVVCVFGCRKEGEGIDTQ